MRHLFVIILLVFPISGDRSLPNTLRRRIPKSRIDPSEFLGRNQFATDEEMDEYEMQQLSKAQPVIEEGGALAGEEGAALVGEEAAVTISGEGFAIAVGEFCVAASPAAPFLLFFSGLVVIGGMLEEHYRLAHKTITDTATALDEKPKICRINIKTLINNGYDQWPLVLNWDLTFRDVNGNGDIDYVIGETAKIACTGDGNIISVLDVPTATITCEAGAVFKYGNKYYNFYEFGCNYMPESKVIFRGNDGLQNNYANYWIGFDIAGFGYIPIMDIYYSGKNVQYVKHTIGFEVGDDPNEAPQKSSGQSWKQGMHPQTALTNLYSGRSILQKMSTLIGPNPANHYFGDWSANKRKMDKGHLAPKTDFPYASQQSATFYYLNSVPQFHAYNAGNWYLLEKGIRMLASVVGKMTVYSGARGVVEINSQRINLDYPVNEFPVPYYLWKVIQIDLNGKKLAFIGLNNPREDNFWNNDDFYSRTFCNQKCTDDDFAFLPNELRVGARNPREGVIMCCKYDDDFKQKTGIRLPYI